jgi:predicted outer membrane protein
MLAAMDPIPTLSELVPLLSERLGLAAIFALAIYAGVVVARAYIASMRDIELARVAVQQTLAAAIQTQAGAVAEHAAADREMRQAVSGLEIVVTRVSQMIESQRDSQRGSHG